MRQLAPVSRIASALDERLEPDPRAALLKARGAAAHVLDLGRPPIPAARGDDAADRYDSRSGEGLTAAELGSGLPNGAHREILFGRLASPGAP